MNYTIPAEWLAQTGFWVYSWRRGKQWLYVGLSERPLARIGGHNVIGRIARVRPTDTIEVTGPYATWEAGAVVEAALNDEHSPRFSSPIKSRGSITPFGKRQCVLCRKDFIQNASSQKYCRRCGLKSGTTPNHIPIRLRAEVRAELKGERA